MSYIALLAIIGTALLNQSLDPKASGPRTAEIQALIKVLKDKETRAKKPESVVAAIERLGELQAREAVPELMALLGFRRTFSWESKSGTMVDEIRLVSPGDRYPAISALFQIGRPALQGLVETIATHDVSSIEGKNASITVMLIFREDPQAAVDYLRRAAQAATSVEAAQRLFAASDSVQLAIQ